MKKTDNTLYHYTASELINPQHPVTVFVIGCGGTGSQMLNNLARVHKALIAIGHPGLHVTAFDGDIITEANLSRQLFSSSELGLNKATALITRINRFYGLRWKAQPIQYELKSDRINCNILVTCVDNVAIRLDIGKAFKRIIQHGSGADKRNFYWMDLGNSRFTGQIVLGTRGEIKQPSKTRNTIKHLPVITELFPYLKKFEKEDQGPSCSLAEALTKQDLFINSILAQYGSNLIWKMFRELRLNYHGVFINLQTLNTNPIKVK